MKSSTEIRSALDATTSQLDAARRMLGVGHPFDLSDLSGRVETICGAIECLPAQERRSLEPPIVTLIDELNKLTEALTRQRDGLAKGLKTIAVGEQASKAYDRATKVQRK
ncbi:MAG TPA: hypothetical protein VM325_12960 [Alphaproteobacteria bacterium]|nr:hypothetical protein [Alphaproteobacteria bacterium]